MGRSPSPAGSSFSRRSRRDDDRYRDRRDDRRRRSRSPGDVSAARTAGTDCQRRRDRDYYNDRRRDDDHARYRRDRSRERERDAPRRDHSRDRGGRRREDSRERLKRRRDASPDSGNKRRRDERPSRGGTPTRSHSDQKPASRDAEAQAKAKAQAQAKEDERKAERLAKLEAWKQKLVAEKAKQGTPPNGAGPSAAPAETTTSAGKFDPKNIVKKATQNATSALGADIELPKTKAVEATPQQNSSARKSDQETEIDMSALKKGNLGALRLGQKQQTEVEKKGIAFEDDEQQRKKLEKLPTPPPEANGHEEEEEDEEDVDMADEESAAAAARAAAEKRETEQREQQRPEPVAPSDNIDPLDAFMSDLTETRAPGLGGLKGRGKNMVKDGEALFENDDALEVVDDEDTFAAIANKAKKKKEVPTVNHAKIKYADFRKDFYTVPSELASLTEADVNDLRLELDGIKVHGVDVPAPVQKWSQCGLGFASLDVIQKMGFERPTAIQAQALPAVMSGRDVIGIAKTGSGKTIAFLLPMFRHIKDQRPLEGMDGPVGLIMTPTRELATQIHKECKPWLKALGLRAVCAYGGAPIKDQIADLKRGAEIVVCTPGRMIDLLAANSGRVTNLRRVTYCVLDEADRMFDMGFEPQVMKIMANIRPQRQTVLFSATFPRNMEALARKTLTKPIEIIVGGRSQVAKEITQLVEVRPEGTKFLRLLQLLGEVHEDDDARSLVFVDRQESAEDLMNAILRKGYPCFAIHGGKDQFDRDSIISDFKAGVFPVLVATSVAARGLDVKQLKMVVNFDCPNHLEDYVHRAGRTGRAGNTGLAVTFITEEQERYAHDIAKALRQSGQDVPPDVQRLVDAQADKIKAGMSKASGYGFGGKGLERLDQERDATKALQRKAYRTGDDDDEETKKEDVADGDGDGPAVEKEPAAAAKSVGYDLDGKVLVHRREGAPVPDKAARVNDAVAAINARLRKGGEMRGGAPIDNKGPDAGAYHSTFEINDLPQKARWAVTNRTNVAKILESTGTSITTKGNFYAPDKVLGPMDPPKLYILVEGDTEMAVTQAVGELRRLAKDGMVAALTSDARAPASGRYTVV